MAAPSTVASSAFNSIRPRALRESVFEILLTAIVRGEMQVGDWLKHQHLAEKLEVSATPLREALQELASYGIVEIQHNRGAMVQPFGAQQLQDLFYVRSLLETDATRLACGRLDQTALREIKELTVQLMNEPAGRWEAKVVASDDRLHQLIAEACGNQRLKEEISRYRSLLNCIRRSVADHHYPLKQALEEHLQVIEALENRAPEEAATRMAHHIRSSAEICSRVMFPGA